MSVTTPPLVHIYIAARATPPPVGAETKPLWRPLLGDLAVRYDSFRIDFDRTLGFVRPRIRISTSWIYDTPLRESPRLPDHLVDPRWDSVYALLFRLDAYQVYVPYCRPEPTRTLSVPTRRVPTAIMAYPLVIGGSVAWEGWY